MSLIEIFDLVIYNAFVKLTSRKRIPRKSQVMNVRDLAEELI